MRHTARGEGTAITLLMSATPPSPARDLPFTHARYGRRRARPQPPAAATPRREDPVYVCCLCRFTVPLDDTLTTTARGGCICLRCYLRVVEDHKLLPTSLRRALEESAAA